jgi:hypothetical protein
MCCSPTTYLLEHASTRARLRLLHGMVGFHATSNEPHRLPHQDPSEAMQLYSRQRVARALSSLDKPIKWNCTTPPHPPCGGPRLVDER